eukprot:Pgem_evm3s17906
MQVLERQDAITVVENHLLKNDNVCECGGKLFKVNKELQVDENGRNSFITQLQNPEHNHDKGIPCSSLLDSENLVQKWKDY